MPQSIPHAQEIKAGVRKGQPLTDGIHQRMTWTSPRLAKHSNTRIKSYNRPGRAHDLTGTLRNQTGPARDIEDVHSGFESRPQQRFSSIPQSRTKTGCLVDIAILVGRAIEQVVEKALTGPILVVVAAQKRMGRQRDELAG